MMDIKSEVRQYILDHHLPGDRSEDLADDVPLFGGGILDSIGALGLITFIESRYGIEFLPRELDLRALASIERIAEVVERKLADLGD
ncbi:MAG: acyl carrier protein [Bryobacteraceae bacterium]|jgi:acyl carrier protein